jgi:hypothetical protein
MSASLVCTTEPFKPAQPQDEEKLWRYMSFSKYVNMLATGSIYFVRADLLDDQFEGARAKANPLMTPTRRSDVKRNARRKFYISSWSMQEHELVALWRLYGASPEGVALRSNFGRLKKVLPKQVVTGCVTYYKYAENKYLEDELERHFTKRRQFATDFELRAIDSCDLDRSRRGLLQKVDLSELIRWVYVAPEATKWFRDTVRAVTRQFGYEFEIRKSLIDSRAVY